MKKNDGENGKWKEFLTSPSSTSKIFLIGPGKGLKNLVISSRTCVKDCAERSSSSSRINCLGFGPFRNT